VKDILLEVASCVDKVAEASLENAICWNLLEVNFSGGYLGIYRGLFKLCDAARVIFRYIKEALIVVAILLLTIHWTLSWNSFRQGVKKY